MWFESHSEKRISVATYIQDSHNLQNLKRNSGYGQELGVVQMHKVVILSKYQRGQVPTRNF